MSLSLSWVAVGCALAAYAGPPDSAADAVTLTEGSVVLGHVLEPGAFGGLEMLVRHDWARAKVPARLRA